MALPSLSRHRARYLIPLAAAAITVVVVVAPQAASGAQHPNLAPRTAAQLLASLENAHLPQFSGTTVETSRLGLPSLDDNELPAGISPGGESDLVQLVTLLTGSHTAQIAYGGPGRQRVAIFLSDLSETDIVHNGTDLWTYSSDSNAVSHSTVSSGDDEATDPSAGSSNGVVDPTTAAEHALAEIDPSTKVTVDRTAEVAGRPAYQLDLAPRDPQTLVSSVRIALDAATWMPLRVEIWSRQDASQPAFSVGFTSISMSPPSPSTFDFTKPPSATTESEPFAGLAGGHTPTSGARRALHSSPAESEQVIGKDWTSVFVDQLAAPGATGGKAGPAGGELGGVLDQFATKVAAGHLITTSLVSILITDDNRILVGAVSPSYLEQVATTGAGQ
jgi:outer membrane lipoprotein-sorting protein